MTRGDECRLYGPNLALIGRGLEHHDVLGHTQSDAAQAAIARKAAGIIVERRSNRINEGAGIRRRRIRQRSHKKGACPPKFLHRQVGGTHIFVGHGSLAIVKGRQVWAVTGAGVEVLA